MKLRAIIISISILVGLTLEGSVLYAGGIADEDLYTATHDWAVEINGSDYGIEIQVPIRVFVFGPDPFWERQRRYVAVFNSQEYSVSEKTFWLFTGILLALITGIALLHEAQKSTKQGQVTDQTLLDREGGE